MQKSTRLLSWLIIGALGSILPSTAWAWPHGIATEGIVGAKRDCVSYEVMHNNRCGGNSLLIYFKNNCIETITIQIYIEKLKDKENINSAVVSPFRDSHMEGGTKSLGGSFVCSPTGPWLAMACPEGEKCRIEELEPQEAEESTTPPAGAQGTSTTTGQTPRPDTTAQAGAATTATTATTASQGSATTSSPYSTDTSSTSTASSQGSSPSGGASTGGSGSDSSSSSSGGSDSGDLAAALGESAPLVSGAVVSVAAGASTAGTAEEAFSEIFLDTRRAYTVDAVATSLVGVATFATVVRTFSTLDAMPVWAQNDWRSLLIGRVPNLRNFSLGLSFGMQLFQMHCDNRSFAGYNLQPCVAPEETIWELSEDRSSGVLAQSNLNARLTFARLEMGAGFAAFGDNRGWEYDFPEANIRTSQSYLGLGAQYGTGLISPFAALRWYRVSQLSSTGWNQHSVVTTADEGRNKALALGMDVQIVLPSQRSYTMLTPMFSAAVLAWTEDDGFFAPGTFEIYFMGSRLFFGPRSFVIPDPAYRLTE